MQNELQEWIHVNHQSERDVIDKLKIWGVVSARRARASDLSQLEIAHALEFMVNTVPCKPD